MFVGRKKELKIVNEFLNSDAKSMLIYGKRRIGKTELIHESLKKSKLESIYFECAKDSYKNNIDSFVHVLVEKKIIDQFHEFVSFVDVFHHLATIDKKLVIIIDEYPYLMEYKNPSIINSHFQNIIDNYLTNNKLILCGSNISVMSSLLEGGNALFGRFNYKLPLKELPYYEAAEFYPNLSTYDKIAFYSIFGGSPYLNRCIDPTLSLEENIKKQFLSIDSDVFSYCENVLFTDIPSSINIRGICSFIKNGKKSCAEIESRLHVDKNGGMNKKLQLLVDMQILSKKQPINKINNPKATRYEINDNAIRFFYTYIANYKNVLVNIGYNPFYKYYVKDSLITFISYRFENIVRDYYTHLIQNSLIQDVINIGFYAYDNLIDKTNGEFDVAMQHVDGSYSFVEAKYYKEGHLLKIDEMKKELEQINKIKDLTLRSLSFMCTSGYENTKEFECINISKLYKLVK